MKLMTTTRFQMRIKMKMRSRSIWWRFIAVILILFSAACDQSEEPEQPSIEELKRPNLILTPASYDDLPQWGSDNFENFAQGFARSCLRIMKSEPEEPFGMMGKSHPAQAGTYAHWQRICKNFAKITDPAHIKSFFEANFTPYQVTADYATKIETHGIFTGYYEASLNGARAKSERYNIPLHKRPDDLVMVHLGEFREDLKGTRIAGRVNNGRLRPYETREDIINNNWPHTHDDNVLLWVDDAVDAFFVQIQGSGLVEMEDGSLMRIGYAGQNGHLYYAIGRELVKRQELEKEKVSMQSIRQWLQDNPQQADEIMNTNKSYVFFREIKGEGPLGAEGTPLTALRSIAVDRTLFSYGTPVWLSTAPQTITKEDGLSQEEVLAPLTRMMIAQDTGGAIQGPVRGDVFWGHGDAAWHNAGIMNQKGRYWVMLPRL